MTKIEVNKFKKKSINEQKKGQLAILLRKSRNGENFTMDIWMRITN